jgi:hypothetical protein
MLRFFTRRERSTRVVLMGYIWQLYADVHHCCVFHTGMSDSEKDICDRRSGSVGGMVSYVLLLFVPSV